MAHRVYYAADDADVDAAGRLLQLTMDRINTEVHELTQHNTCLSLVDCDSGCTQR